MRIKLQVGKSVLQYICNTPKYTIIVFNVFRVFCRYKLKFFVIIILLSEKILKPGICTRYKGKSVICQNGTQVII